MNKEDKKIIELASRTIELESKAVKDLRKSLDSSFVGAIKTLASSRGKILLCGIGKSGIIARKISATMASVGIESIFIHPIEALHGDMGAIYSQDIAIALSNSGQTAELNNFLKQIKYRKIKIISITSNPKSLTARLADINININVKREACPHNLIPTSSTTAMLAIGDAISICLMDIKGFGKQTFALHHPAGKLGKILNVKVGAIMRKGRNNPSIKPWDSIGKAIEKMTGSSLGAVSVIDKNGKLLGFFTDGDLRRKFSHILLKDDIEKHMTKAPLSISAEETAAKAAEIMQERGIDNIPVVDKKGKLIGVVDERDLIREGLL